MAQSTHKHRLVPPHSRVSNPLAGKRLRRLQHLHSLSPERQVVFLCRTRHTHPATQPSSACPVEPALRDEMLARLPNLRAFARSLTRDRAKADDLVQDTLLRAWSNIDKFERGTNLEAWLFTILRNALYTEHRKHRFEVADPDGKYAAHLKVLPEQEAALTMVELHRALAHLPRRLREALLLIAVEGMSYEEVAIRQGVAVGTVKSRVSRARHHLAHLLNMDDRHQIEPDQVMQAALQAT
jgi:RNA polymerase sigma-70 factor (ECF subfamily)